MIKAQYHLRFPAQVIDAADISLTCQERYGKNCDIYFTHTNAYSYALVSEYGMTNDMWTYWPLGDLNVILDKQLLSQF